MIIRPAATSSRTCSAVRCGSRAATRRISAVIVPSLACSNWVTGEKPAGGTQASDDSYSDSNPGLRTQPAGMNSQAVFIDGAGMPGVSGDENVNRPAAPAAMRLGAAKLAGLVPARLDDAFPPNGGSENGKPAKSDSDFAADPNVDIAAIPLRASDSLYPSHAGWNCNEF